MLAYLAERMAQASCIVSYNGKAFDWPLLRTRSILNRVPLAEPVAHLDLLHCARRLLKPKLESVRLTDVERELLGHYREDDVHGSAIPLLYLDYLRGGDVEPLLSVLEHNASDLIGLAAILPRIASHFAEVRSEDDPSEHLAYAKVALRARDFSARSVRAAASRRDSIRGGQAHQVVAASSRSRGDVAWRLPPARFARAADNALQPQPCIMRWPRCSSMVSRLLRRALHARIRLRAKGRRARPSRRSACGAACDSYSCPLIRDLLEARISEKS